MEVLVKGVKLHPGFFYRESLGDISKLMKSMDKSHGLLHPIIVDKDHFLIVGRRRWEAAKQLKWESIEARVMDMDDPHQAIEDENDCREPFTPSEKVAMGKWIEEKEKVKAAERMKSGKDASGEGGGRGNTKPSEKFSEGLGEAKVKAAEAVGMSRPTYEKAKAVVEAAAEDPSLEPIVEEMDRTGNVSAAHRQVQAAKEPTVLCAQCARNVRVGKPITKGCKDCKEARNPEQPKADPSLPKSVANALADTWHAENARLLSKMAKECKSAFSWSSFLDASVLDHLKAAEECFLTAMPRRVCPDCQGQKTINKNPCQKCRHGGYLASQV